MPPGWKLHSTDILPLRVFMLITHVTKDWMRNPRLYSLDQILTVDRRVHSVFAEHRRRNNSHFLDSCCRGPVAAAFRHLPPPDRGWVGSRRYSCFDEAGRVQPDIQLPELCAVWGWNRRGSLSIQVPSKGSVDHEGLSFFLLERRSPKPTGSVFLRPRVHPRLASELFYRRPGVTVNGPGVVRQWLAARPVRVLRDVLADFAGIAGPGKRDTFQIVGTHRLGGGPQDRPGIDMTRRDLLAFSRPARDRQHHKENP